MMREELRKLVERAIDSAESQKSYAWEQDGKTETYKLYSKASILRELESLLSAPEAAPQVKAADEIVEACCKIICWACDKEIPIDQAAKRHRLGEDLLHCYAWPVLALKGTFALAAPQVKAYEEALRTIANGEWVTDSSAQELARAALAAPPAAEPDWSKERWHCDDSASLCTWVCKCGWRGQNMYEHPFCRPAEPPAGEDWARQLRTLHAYTPSEIAGAKFHDGITFLSQDHVLDIWEQVCKHYRTAAERELAGREQKAREDAIEECANVVHKFFEDAADEGPTDRRIALALAARAIRALSTNAPSNPQGGGK